MAAVNDAPASPGLKLSVSEDSSVTGLSGTDVDGDSLIFSLDSDGKEGNAIIKPDGSFIYTPDPNYSGSDSFTYRVSDGQGGSTTGTVSVTVNAINDAPTSPGANITVDEDETATGLLSAEDVDGDRLSFELGDGPTNGTATVNADGSYSYTPNAGYNGADSFTYTVSDGNGGTATATMSLTVTNVNDAPVTPGLNVTTDEDTAVAGILSATDEEGDSLSFALDSAPSHGSAIVNADGSYSYTPNADYSGDDSFSYTVSDGNGGNFGRGLVTIRGVNDGGPAAKDDDGGSLDEDGSIILSAASLVANDTDPDGDNLEVTAVGDAVNGTVIMVGDTITFTPKTD